MGANIVQVGATIMCPHQGMITAKPGNNRVKLSGNAVTTESDMFSVQGCTFQIVVPPPKAQPCMQVQWMKTSTRVRVGGQKVVLMDSTGLCKSAENIPQGPPQFMVVQQRVKGT